MKFKVIASNGQQICNLKTSIKYGCKKKIFSCVNEKDITLISSPLIVKFTINADPICEIFYDIKNVIFVEKYLNDNNANSKCNALINF